MAKNVDFKAIRDAEDALRDYLEKHPQHQPFQDKYDEYMKKAGPKPENRLIYFRQFMRETMAEHHAVMTEARDKLLKYVDILKELANASPISEQQGTDRPRD